MLKKSDNISKFKKISGYTLIELSMVIVIITLLVGGVTAGVGVYNNTRLNAIGAEVQKITNMTQLFYDKYGYLPGNMPDAAVLPGVTGFVGTGNGVINNTNEAVWFWYHLVQAGMLKGNYTKTTTGQYNVASAASVGGAYPSDYKLGLGYIVLPVIDTTLSGTNGGLTLRFAKFKNIGVVNNIPAFRTKEAYQIDKKFDDGLPLSGKYIASDGFSIPAGQCVTGGNYNFTTSGNPVCVFNITIDTGTVIDTTTATCSNGQIGSVRTSSTSCPANTYGQPIDRCVLNPTVTPPTAFWQTDTSVCKQLLCQGGIKPNEYMEIPCSQDWAYNSAASSYPENAAMTCSTYFSNINKTGYAATIYQCKNGLLRPFMNCCAPKANMPCGISNELRSIVANPGIRYTYGGIDTNSKIQQCSSGVWQTNTLTYTEKSVDTYGYYRTGDQSTNPGMLRNVPCTVNVGGDSTQYYQYSGGNTYPQIGDITGNVMPVAALCTLKTDNTCPQTGAYKTIPCPPGQIGQNRLTCKSTGYWDYDYSYSGSSQNNISSCQPVTCNGDPIGSFRINKKLSCPSGMTGDVIEVCRLNRTTDYYNASWQLDYDGGCYPTLCYQSDAYAINAAWSPARTASWGFNALGGGKISGFTNAYTAASNYLAVTGSINHHAFAQRAALKPSISQVMNKFDAVTPTGNKVSNGAIASNKNVHRYCMPNGHFAYPDIPAAKSVTGTTDSTSNSTGFYGTAGNYPPTDGTGEYIDFTYGPTATAHDAINIFYIIDTQISPDNTYTDISFTYTNVVGQQPGCKYSSNNQCRTGSASAKDFRNALYNNAATGSAAYPFSGLLKLQPDGIMPVDFDYTYYFKTNPSCTTNQPNGMGVNAPKAPTGYFVKSLYDSGRHDVFMPVKEKVACTGSCSGACSIVEGYEYRSMCIMNRICGF